MAVCLHGHSTFSKLDAYGLPEQIVQRAKELGLKAVSITDHGNTSAHPKLEMACDKYGMKPIYGVELYLNTKEQKKNHVTVLAKNLKGYENLLHLSSLAYQDGYFYYMPCVDLEDVYKYQEDLIILTGCMSGKASRHILDDRLDEAMEVLIEMKENIEHLFVEIQPFDLEESRKINKVLIRMAKQLELPIVATNDCHFVRPEDCELQHFLSMTRRKKNYLEMPNMLSRQCALASQEQFVEWMQEYKDYYPEWMQCIENQDLIADMIEHFELPKAKNVQISDEPEDVRYEKLVEECRIGWRKRKFDKKDKRYYDQLMYELKIIRDKGYIDYFLVVSDCIRWAKANNILVGPARGSAGASLVAWFTGITEIDPIRFNLLFERFLDPSRNDPPDIDIDFQNDRRDEVKQYLRDRYGADKVANVAGYTLYHDKGLLDDIGRNYCVPKYVINQAKNNLKSEGGAYSLEEVLESLREAYPQIPENMQRMLGQLRGFTVHAGGVIVSTMPLAKTTTMMGDTIALDKRDAEYMNLLKIDALSLTTLRVIALALEKIGMTVEELYNVDLYNPEVLKGFQEGKLQGIFQYSGVSTAKVCIDALKDYDMDTADLHQVLNTVIDVNTLSRPASMNNGSTSRYIRYDSDAIHPILERHTKDTRGQIIYQEQIMRVLRDAGISWKDITQVRKIIQGKGKKEELPRIRQAFIDHLVNDGTDVKLAEQVWDRLGDEGAYGFNVAHCVAYTLVAYFTMYLMKFHREEFYWANLVDDPENEDLLRQYVMTGGRVLPVKFGKSKAHWSIQDGCLRAGYVTVKGIGEKSALKLEQMTDDSKLAAGVRKKLEEAEAFTPETELDDYLKLRQLEQMAKTVKFRQTVEEVTKERDFTTVKMVGKIGEIHFKNLKEYYDDKGYDWDEVEIPDHQVYVNFRLVDESGDIVCTIDRHTYGSDPTLQDILGDLKGNEVFRVIGNFNKNKGKISKARLELLGQI